MTSNECRSEYHGGLSKASPYVVHTSESYPTIHDAPYPREASEDLHTQHLISTYAPAQLLENTNYCSVMAPVPVQTSWDNLPSPWNNRYLHNEFPSMPQNHHEIAFPSVPRTWQMTEPPALDDCSASLDSCDPSYMLGYRHHEPQTPPNLSPSFPYTTQDPTPESARLNISHSPKRESENLNAQMSNISAYRQASNALTEGNSPSRELVEVDAEDQSVEEPYAKLIHRALMSTPNRSMALQDIYEWFRRNTNKGSSTTKGWMNSIRHNLSMNAAFKKTERKTPGEEGRKCTEWILEDFSIKDGVQSTTRYRKGTGTKKSGRSERPDPSRQISGRKGGISTNRIKMQRQKHRDERDFRRTIQRYDANKLTQFVQQSQDAQKCLSSPLTPPALDEIMEGPFCFPKMECFESPSEYRFEDLQGIYHDDLPLFTNHGMPLSSNLMCSDQQY